MKRVGVIGRAAYDASPALLSALEALFPVVFEALSPGEAGVDGLLVLDGDLAAGVAAARSGVPALVVLRPGTETAPGAHEIRFGSSLHLDPVLKSNSLVERSPGPHWALCVEPGDEVLASAAGRPVWVARPCGKGCCHLVGIAPPRLSAGGYLFQYFNRHQFMGLLPLLSFLREVVKEIDFPRAALRALFVFDDPSLHWRSYGYLNFAALADHARKHGYFVSIGTIPCDTWWVDRGVASVFRSCAPRLSLLVHGNGHTRRELLGQEPLTNLLSLAAQALRRMRRLELHGVPFQRVMEAPHGAIAAGMFEHLLALGYEGALATPELLVANNPGTRWPQTLGLRMAEMLGGGLPVIPRIKMSRHWRTEAVLAAFLGQPVVLVGHHQDAANGFELLAEFAREANRLGQVEWSDMTGILRSNFLRRRQAAQLRVRMFSRSVSVEVPQGVRSLCVERPWMESNSGERLKLTGNGLGLVLEAAGPVTEVSVPEGASCMQIISETAHPVDYSKVPPPHANVWPLVRKLLMEARDRAVPLLPFADTLRRTSAGDTETWRPSR